MGKRVFAFLVDATVHSAFGIALFGLWAQRTTEPVVTSSGARLNATFGQSSYVLQGGAAVAFMMLMLGLSFVHLVVVQGRTGATLGKRIMGLRVVDERGGVCGPRRAALRWLFWFVDDFPYLIPGAVGFFVAISTPQRRRVGDIVAGTFVVREAAMVGRPVPDEPAPPTGYPVS